MPSLRVINFKMTHFFHFFLYLFQMKNNNIPLAIILKRTQNGYTFEALQEVESLKDKNKKSKLGRKPAVKGVPNRLIKEIGLSNQQIIAQITPPPEPQPVHPIEEDQGENHPIFQQINEQQQFSCQVQRETELPKSPAIWFDKLKIHQIEKRELKEFFSGSENKKPELYLKYRNFIVESYEKNPKRYLTKISCRRILRGDVITIMKIHSFLEKHGIINFSLHYDNNFSFKKTSITKYTEQRTTPQTVLKGVPEEDEETAEKQIDTDNMTITVINKNFSRTYRACCTQCKLICGIVWFANISDEETSQKNLCFECFEKLGENQKGEYSKIDIVKKMQAHGRDAKNFPKNAWNIEENIKLLDFMSNSSGQRSWKKLLNEFGGKRTIQDIILQFLQFPISNVDIKTQKKQLQRSLVKSSNSKKQLGYNSTDYTNILKDFYESSSYNQKIKKQEEGMKTEKSQVLPALIDDSFKESEGIQNVLKLTVDKLLTQLSGLKQQEHLIQYQLAHFDSTAAFKKNMTSVQDDEIPAKSTNDLQMKSKSLKNLNEKRNESSQLFDDFEDDLNGDL